MPKAGIISNINRDSGLEFARQVADWLYARGCEVYAESAAAEGFGPRPPTGLRLLAEDELYAAVDFLVCLGGDGTILRASRNACYNKPLLGINLGRLGYLTDVERKNAFEALELTLNGQYTTERRMMLEAVAGGGTYLALNDVCVTRGAFSKLIELELYINGEYIDTYRADGVIVCTPTGSTAYNLSAGGPILKPDVEMMAVTPICAHMIYSRSIVISAADEVKLRIVAHYRDDCMLSLDGCHENDLNAGDEVIIRRSEYYTTIIKTNKLSFFDILRSKMVGKGC